MCSSESISNLIMISAVIDEKITVNAGLSSIFKHEKCKHRAEFGISIQREYCGEGMGTLIPIAIFEEAKKVVYEPIELEVVIEREKCPCRKSAEAFFALFAAYLELYIFCGFPATVCCYILLP